MKIASFFKLVEIQTKVASIIPLVIGILFCIYRYQVLRLDLIGLFFISMICFDLSTTALNNVMDYKKAIKKEGYNYEVHNAMVKDSISENTAITTIVIMLFIGAVAGFGLFLLTDWVVLLIGVLSFIIGVLYSYGPVPISRTPFGELFSGIVMGGFIFFVTVYMQVYQNGLVIAYVRDDFFNLQLNMVELSILIFTSIPLVLMIAGIMLANNICDIEDDILNKRFTLPFFIGKKSALVLFVLLYVISFLVIVVGVLFKFLPVINLLVFIAALPIIQNMKVFMKEQNKASTFIVSVKNFIVFSAVWIVSFVLNTAIETFIS